MRIFLLLVPGAVQPREVAAALARGEGRWLAPAGVKAEEEALAQAAQRTGHVVASWQDAFRIKEGRASKKSGAGLPGLRRPQIGALHAALAHATRSTEPATIVMPTGTGKTETMLALDALQRFERLLVVVPTDALREQIAGKFETSASSGSRNASPNRRLSRRDALSHTRRTAAEVDQMFDSANVVVTTMQIAGRRRGSGQERMAAGASRLFIDEAHHIGAPTWAAISRPVRRRPAVPIVQFTATPFREDGRRVDGEYIYTYPLKKAQAEGYFKPIRFEAVFGLDQAETPTRRSSKSSARCWQADLDAGLNHLAMARCPPSSARRICIGSTARAIRSIGPSSFTASSRPRAAANGSPRFAASKAGSSSASTCWEKASICPSSRSRRFTIPTRASPSRSSSSAASPGRIPGSATRP